MAVVDVERGSVLPGRTVVVDRGRIAAVGAAVWPFVFFPAIGAPDNASGKFSPLATYTTETPTGYDFAENAERIQHAVGELATLMSVSALRPVQPVD